MITLDPTGPAVLRRIVELLNAGDAAQAFELCRKLRGGDPALDQLAATAALRSRHFSEAAALAERSLAARPDHVETLLILGRAASVLQDHDTAIAALTRAAAIDPDRAEPAFMLHAARVDAGDAAAALDLAGLAARFPEEAQGWDDIINSLSTRGEREEALACLSRQWAAAPSHATAMRRGLTARDLGRSAEARQAFEDAVALEPGSARGWFLLGVAAQDRHDDEAAETAYCRALALDPTLAEAAVNLGIAMQRGGDLEGAKAAYAQAVEMRPDTFGRVAQAMTTAPKGELWLDLRALRRSLGG